MTIAVDFDGVLHRYSRGWQDGTIYDGPMPGAADGLRRLMRTDAVFIFTARDDLQAVAEWVSQHLSVPTIVESMPTNGFWNRRDAVLVTNRKLPAQVYIDDRAVTFTSWDAVHALIGN